MSESVSELFELDCNEMLSHLERLVMAESPSADIALTTSCAAVVSELCRDVLGERPQQLEVGGRPHLWLRSGQADSVLLLAHLDTVWPAGTTASWPFTVHEDRATGPGVFDMKAGLVQGLHALRACGSVPVDLLVTSDEEVGSPTSRAIIEAEAGSARAVLVLEPSAGGAPKTARKGVSMYRLAVHGRAAHAGLEPELGVNALVEMARVVSVLGEIADSGLGTTVTPTTALAGTTTNTVPALAEVCLDVRAWSAMEQSRVDQDLRSLVCSAPDAWIEVHGGVNRPAMEASTSTALMDIARRCAAELGVSLPEGRAVGGASDGNFSAGLGVPTLDGLGAVGDHAHARGEYALVSALTERAKLLALLLQTITTPSTGEG